jgi:hypothetical protein
MGDSPTEREWPASAISRPTHDRQMNDRHSGGLNISRWAVWGRSEGMALNSAYRRRVGLDILPKRRRLSCPVAVGTFKKNPASMLARRDVPDTGQHILPVILCGIARVEAECSEAGRGPFGFARGHGGST